MSNFAFHQVDVFSDEAFRGNALAVISGADALTTETMQAIATWTNLSETAFLLEPSEPRADYRVRIFTTSGELPFAGHPTLGAAATWLRESGRIEQDGRLVQECGLGLVDIRHEGGRFAFASPPLTRYEPLDGEDLERVAGALGIDRARISDHSWLVNGPEWAGLLLGSAEEVLGLRPDPALFGEAFVGVIGPYPEGHDTAFEVRGFVGGDAVFEDPVTGSLNAGFAEWLISTGRAPRSYVAAQGTNLGRRGRVRIDAEGDRIWVGGHVTAVVSGTATIPV